MKYARLTGAEARLLLVLREAPVGKPHTWYMAQANIATDQTYYRSRKKLLDEGLITLGVIARTPASMLPAIADDEGGGDATASKKQIDADASKDNQFNLSLEGVQNHSVQNHSTLISNTRGVENHSTSLILNTTGAQNHSVENHSTLIQNTPGVQNHSTPIQNTPPNIGPSNKEKIGAILRAWNSAYTTPKLTAQTAQQFLTFAGGDYERVVALIEDAASREYVTKPIGWMLTVLKSKPKEEAPKTVEEAYAVTDDEKRIPTDEELQMIREERQRARELLAAAFADADERGDGQ